MAGKGAISMALFVPYPESCVQLFLADFASNAYFGEGDHLFGEADHLFGEADHLVRC